MGHDYPDWHSQKKVNLHKKNSIQLPQSLTNAIGKHYGETHHVAVDFLSIHLGEGILGIVGVRKVNETEAALQLTSTKETRIRVELEVMGRETQQLKSKSIFQNAYYY